MKIEDRNVISISLTSFSDLILGMVYKSSFLVCELPFQFKFLKSMENINIRDLKTNI